MSFPAPFGHLAPLTAAVVAALSLMGCASSGGSVAPNPFKIATSSGATQPHIGTLRVFGDSYSDIAFTNSQHTGNWVRELGARIPTDVTLNYAIGGARAGYAGHREFNRQLDTMTLRGQDKVGDTDLTIVYLGHNDINRGGARDDLAHAKFGLTDGVNRLKAMGAANENRRLFVTQLHDWSKNPGVEDSTHNQVVAWNAFIAGVANSNPNIVAVDMYTAFERIFANPQAFGFNNVSTPDASRSAVDALFHDTTHFGTRGQTIIARVYEHYLTRGWEWSNSVAAGAESAQRLGAEVDSGILAFNLRGTPTAAGFNLIPIGQTSATDRHSVASNRFATLNDPHANATVPTGVALDFTASNSLFKKNGRYGFAITQNDNAQQLHSTDRLLQRYSSKGSTFYWHQPVSSFLFTTQLSNLTLRVENNARDELLDRSFASTSVGNTWSFEQKIRRPMGNEWMSITPWASFSSQTHQLKPYVSQSLYTSDVSYSASRARDVFSGIGFDVQFAPLALQNGKTLTFSGGFSHTESLYRSALSIAMTEANQPGVPQRETIERAKFRSTLAGVNASLGVSKSLNFSASYAADLQKTKDTQRVSLLANLLF
ncbi:MAG TPA: hypothetical protein DCY64_05715 [Hydrogenophaga sp.]|uniref:GDSL-type esterase/lipase family protein n=1 Tax=Hydrogenophaga sp. TaxID=1904254 RepID=UPI0008B43B42|nr:GDSL-type esterase/lipase family protein [Hydrogenophaga sp.]OGA76589.1 MAG: hypothetical protein A2X73_20015 [Burkholderiales bacterium GWE1_65_30]OGA91505.1 MAG: hypothetical protein A2X72_04920 [Burkholderiales bacterium GWF1_66_17]HAX19763.1 hypothetical protein [Hydrogenophaga sp.]HBU20178.1 hypothetical protein [Hydrogenophaga sp.]